MQPMPTGSWNAFRRDPREENFAPLYEETKGLVYTLCRRILRNEEDAHDAFQAAYSRLIALAREPNEAAEVADVAACVGHLAVREAENLRKRRSRSQSRFASADPSVGKIMNQPDSAPSPRQAASEHQIRERIESVVATLDDSYGLPILLHYFHGMTHQQIADTLGTPVKTISSRIARGLKKLEAPMRRAGLGDAITALGVAGTAGWLAAPSGVAAAAIYGAAQAAVAAGTVAGGAAAGAGLLKSSLATAILSTKGGIFVSGLSAGILIFVALAFSRLSQEPAKEKPAPPAQAQVALQAEKPAPEPVAPPAAPEAENPPKQIAQAEPPAPAPKKSRAEDSASLVAPTNSSTEPPKIGVLYSQWSSEDTDYSTVKSEGWSQGYYAQQLILTGLRMGGFEPYAVIEPGSLERGELKSVLNRFHLLEKVVVGSDLEAMKKLDGIGVAFCPNVPDAVVETIIKAVESGVGLISIGEFGSNKPGNTDKMKEFLGVDRSPANWKEYGQMELEMVGPQELNIGAAAGLSEGYKVAYVHGYHGVVDGTPLLAVPDSIDDALYPAYIRRHGKGRIGVLQSNVAPGGYGGANSTAPSLNMLAIKTAVQQITNWAVGRAITSDWNAIKKQKSLATSAAAPVGGKAAAAPGRVWKVGILLSKPGQARTDWYSISAQEYTAHSANLFAAIEQAGGVLHPILEPGAGDDPAIFRDLQTSQMNERVIQGTDVSGLKGLDLIISHFNPRIAPEVVAPIAEAVRSGVGLLIVGETGATSPEAEAELAEMMGLKELAGHYIVKKGDQTGKLLESAMWKELGVEAGSEVSFRALAGYPGAFDGERLIEMPGGDELCPLWRRSVGSGRVIVAQFGLIYSGNMSKQDFFSSVPEMLEDTVVWAGRLLKATGRQ